MIDKKKIHQILSSLWKNDTAVGTMDYNQALQDVQTAIDLFPEEPVSEDLEEAAETYTNSRENEKFEVGEGYDMDDVEKAFKAGAQWQHKQLEKNRLAACDRQTKEEAEREQDFVDKILLGEHRQPTFSDAIEYGAQWQKQQMMKDLLVGYVCLNQTAHNEEIPDHCIITNEEPKEIFDKRGLKEGDLVKIIIIKED